ncbi:uncharacterized protein LOC134789021, partial [Penaeus indicus]|uniref:uncharacterized protein LOC134789021 n=1 Tax=Penaeus indicus TaxID=29960 RepID=UPI00300C0A70
MRLTVSVLWMVAVTAWALEENSGSDLYDGHFPPFHPNYTQSLTDLLLLRQEIQLKELKQAEQESAGILREMADLLADIKGSLTRNNTSTGISCPGNFRNFGETYLYLAKDVGINWEEALLFCEDLGGHLAVFRDVNAFAHALGYIKAS